VAEDIDFRETDVFYKGMEGYDTFRVPAIVRANDGTLLAFAEGRKNSSSDSGDIDIVLRRSFTNGLDWEPMQIVWDNGTGVAGNPCPVVDCSTGDILLLSNHQTPDSTQSTIRDGTLGERVYHVQRSTNTGADWTAPDRIGATDVLNPRWLAGGPNHGIQLTQGAAAGRLVVAGNHSTGSDFTTNQGNVIYSDDGGDTWELGAVGGETPEIYVSETAAVELLDGTIYFTTRDQHGPSVGNRAYTTSRDAGESFDADFQIDLTIIAPVVHGSILRYSSIEAGDGENRILQSYPYSTSTRENILVRSSFDETGTWNLGRVIYEGSSAYSDLVRAADGRVGLFYEKDDYTKITFASFTTDWLDYNDQGPPMLIGDGRMLGFWKLDDGAGQVAADSSGAARHGRLGDQTGTDGKDPTWLVDAQRGTVLDFSGGDYVDLSEHVAGFQGVEHGTIALWMKTTSTINQAVMSASDSTDQSSEIRMMMEDAFTMWFDFRDESSSPDGEDGHVESQAIVNDGQWHFVVATVGRGNNARIYVDGQLQGAGTEPFFVVQSLNQMAIGRNVDLTGPQWQYDGLIDDLAIFDRPLSAAMVAAVYELDQDGALGYDIAQAIELFQLALGESVTINDLTWYATAELENIGIGGQPGELVAIGDNYYILLAHDGTGLSTVALLPGDANCDGTVDNADAAVLASNWQTAEGAGWTDGDFNGDGAVNGIDATLLAACWQMSHQPQPGDAVPEPSAWLLLACLAGSFFGVFRLPACRPLAVGQAR
jgi:sialidase-1